MATKEEQDVLRLLVQHVARGFYEPKYTIVLDMLARHTVLKDDDFAGRMGMQAKELNKLVAVLLNDRLIKMYRQNELKEGAQRSVGRQYYYVDYEDFTNVVKWRVARMRNMIDSNLRNELDNKGYICPQCNTAYSPLDVDKLMDFSLNAFICEICQAELIDNENADNVRGSKDRMQRFNHQMRFIRQGLQKIDSMVLPAFDITAWVKNTAMDHDSAQDQSGPGLKIAGSGPATQDAGIGIMLSMDKDEATKKLERDAEAAAKRQQNALPAWHLKSTISGDLTALGVRENARAEQVAPTSSNDDILRGLGVVGGNKRTPSFTAERVEDVKPVINHEADLYEQYYASLAASNAASTVNTPSGLGASSGDDFGVEEEEDKKPSVEYLNSLNDYRKRSRSAEDVGGAKVKAAKMEENGHALPSTNGHQFNGIVDPPPEQGASADDDPIIMVDGKGVRFSEVTEEHHDLMTPDEYTAYFDVLQARESM